MGYRKHDGDIVCEMGPHHADELDELKADGNNHWVLKVSDGTDHLIVASKELFDQAGLIWGGPRHAYREQGRYGAQMCSC